LEKNNAAVRGFLWAWLDGKKKGREQMVDFNDLYVLSNEEGENALAISLELVSLVIPSSGSWQSAVQAKLNKLGPGLKLRDAPITSNFTLTVLVDADVYVPRHKFNNDQKAKGVTSKDVIREEYEKYRGETQSRNETVFVALSGLKRLVLGAVFERHFDAAALGDDTETEWERLTAYKNEAVYVRAHQNCVRVIYQIQFSCREEEIFGKIFAQEFNEAKRKLAGLPVPPVTWTDQDPNEITPGLLVPVTKGRDVHYFKFSIERQHIVSGTGRDRAIDQLLMFRNYLDYHIKCSKAYMHSRMRFKTAYFLQILNRADDTANNKKSSVAKR